MESALGMMEARATALPIIQEIADSFERENLPSEIVILLFSASLLVSKRRDGEPIYRLVVPPSQPWGRPSLR